MNARSKGILTGVALVGAAAAVPAALAYIFLHPPRRFHRNTPKTALGLDYERVRLTTDDGLVLSAWRVPHPQARAKNILCHGYSANRESMLPYLEFLHRAGFEALLFDFRRHGWSEGNMASFGHNETKDLRAALRYFTGPAETLPLALLGESMGAAIALQVAAEVSDVRAVVADSAFARLDSAVRGRLSLALGDALARLVTPPTQAIGERLLGVSTRRIAPVEAAPKLSGRPTLLIHGDADGLIPLENAFALQEACGEQTQLWVTPGIRHVKSVHDVDEYGERVVEFLEEALFGNS